MQRARSILEMSSREMVKRMGLTEVMGNDGGRAALDGAGAFATGVAVSAKVLIGVTVGAAEVDPLSATSIGKGFSKV